jgi:hypothetical protein
MLLVFLLMQWMPVDAHAAVADAMNAPYSWQAVRTEIAPAWTITVEMPQHKRPEFTLQQTGPAEPVVDSRSFSLTIDLSASAALGSAMLNPPIDDAMPAGSNLEGDSATPLAMIDSGPSVDPVMVSGGLSSSATTLARFIAMSDSGVNIPNGNNGGVGTVPPPGNNPGGPGSPNGPGGGVGTPIPEPASIALLAMALPLLLRRRSTRRNHTR